MCNICVLLLNYSGVLVLLNARVVYGFSLFFLLITLCVIFVQYHDVNNKYIIYLLKRIIQDVMQLK